MCQRSRMIDYGKSDPISAPPSLGKFVTSFFVCERDCLEVRCSSHWPTHVHEALLSTLSVHILFQSTCDSLLSDLHLLIYTTPKLAQEFVARGLKPAVLNAASERKPGGEWRTGAGALEENMFRRTTYCISLEDEFNRDKKRKWRCV